jgi:hypothetical protein
MRFYVVILLSAPQSRSLFCVDAACFHLASFFTQVEWPAQRWYYWMVSQSICVKGQGKLGLASHETLNVLRIVFCGR